MERVSAAAAEVTDACVLMLRRRTGALRANSEGALALRGLDDLQRRGCQPRTCESVVSRLSQVFESEQCATLSDKHLLSVCFAYGERDAPACIRRHQGFALAPVCGSR